MWHQIIYGIKSGMKTANEQNAAPMFFEKHIEPTARTVWKAPRQTRICKAKKIVVLSYEIENTNRKVIHHEF